MKAAQPLAPPEHLEETTDALKERIYATLALLAVMVSIHGEVTSPLAAVAEIGGTALSLWAASMVAASMAYRAVQGHMMPRHAFSRLGRVHAPLLWAAVPPILTLSVAATRIISVPSALIISICLSILVLMGWSILSARAFQASKMATLVLAAAEVGIGLAIVGLKLLVSHV